MGNQPQNPKHKPKKLTKIQVEVACIKVKAHLELVKDRKSNDVRKSEKQLANMINGQSRNKTEELLLAEKIINDLKYIQACSTLMAYANTLKNYAGMIAESEGQANRLQQLLIYVLSIIYAAQYLGLSSLNEFKAIMMAFFGCEMITVQAQQVDPKIVEAFKVKPTPFEINTYFLDMADRNQLSLEKINEVHQFSNNPTIPVNPNTINPYQSNTNHNNTNQNNGGNNPYANSPYNNANQQNHGNNPYGNNPYGNNPYGENPHGNQANGNNPYGNNPYGNNAQGNNPYGNNPNANNPYGNISHLNNPFGNNPNANNPYNNNAGNAGNPGNPYQNNANNFNQTNANNFNPNANPYPGIDFPSNLNHQAGNNMAKVANNGPGFNPTRPSNLLPQQVPPTISPSPMGRTAQNHPPPNFANFDEVKLNDINSIDDIPQYPDMDMNMDFMNFGANRNQQPVIPPVPAAAFGAPAAGGFVPQMTPPVFPSPPAIFPGNPVSMSSQNPFPEAINMDAINNDALNFNPNAKGFNPNPNPQAFDIRAMNASDLHLDNMDFHPSPEFNLNSNVMDANFDLICEEISKGL